MHYRVNVFLIASFLALSGCGGDESREDEWRPLFDGTSLDGWEQFGGEPDDWRVEDGVLMGSGVKNRLVYTRESFSDIRLQAECRLSEKGNSGVYVRAKADAASNGYEAQLAFPDSPGRGNVNVGGVWKYSTFDENLVSPGEWFTIEIEAIGPRVLLRVNGEEAVSFEDDTYAEGHVALQGWQRGTTVEFRRIEVLGQP